MSKNGWNNLVKASKVRWEGVSESPEETAAVAADLALALAPSNLLSFYGDLGAGKTTFIKSLIATITGISEEEVCSPTYTYLNIYPGKLPVYHFDLYRLRDADDFLGMGFEEYFTAGGICCIEWSERIPELLPPGSIKITLTHLGRDRRQIQILDQST